MISSFQRLKRRVTVFKRSKNSQVGFAATETMERDDDDQFHGHHPRRIPSNSSPSAPNSRATSSPRIETAAAAAAAAVGGQRQPLPMDQYMPIANLTRVMRRVLPVHAKISDDAKETLQECVSEFISFITSEANDRCHHELRKTITAEDVIGAMGKLGFDDYIDPLTLYLHRYRESENERDRLPVRRGREYGPLVGAANYGPPPSLLPLQMPWGLHIGSQPGLYDAAAPMVTRDYFKDGPDAGGSTSSSLPPEYK